MCTHPRGFSTPVAMDALLSRRGAFTLPDFDPGLSEDIKEFIAESPVLCVGAGGLGCEILKDLALTGFKNIHVIDMDTIDVTNLNRQFLFRKEDVGKPKAEVAAKRVMQRVPGVNVTVHVGMIQDMDTDFYEQFPVFILGLDSIEARRYMNGIACFFLDFDADGIVKPETIKPMVDGGTEGLRGHARVIYPGMTPCFECTLWLFPPQVKFPLCTLAETPRSPAHCIEYAHLILWGKVRDEEFDSDNEEHMQWVCDRALERAQEYNIPGVTLQLTQGVVKNIIPAIPSTNAIIAAACVLEAFKILAAGCLKSMDNYMMYMGSDGVYTHTVPYERDTGCLVCGSGLPLPASDATTLEQLMKDLQSCAQLEGKLTKPSVSVDTAILYMHGPLEDQYRKNLAEPIRKLLPQPLSVSRSCMITVTDTSQQNPIRIRLVAKDDDQMADV
eukprot:jgi/Ulvmu1/7309/UM035_0098.1